jgi:PKD repeat protein
MVNKRGLLNITMVLGILILLIGMSVVSSTDDIVEDVPDYHNHLESVDSSEKLLLHGKVAYTFHVYPGPVGPCFFQLDNPGDITMLTTIPSTYQPSGGTWTTDGRWLGCEGDSGCLLEINPETGDMWVIGGGGIGCYGLAWDPLYNRLYATDGSNLIEYDPDTGEQEFIGSHCQPGKTMIALAINLDGVCYAWDVKFSGDAILYTINLETGEATEVASMGESLAYEQDGAFDWDTGILYLAAYYSIGQLMICDVETGELTLVGNFEGGAELTALAIPWCWGVPQADFIWTPIHPNPSDMILFNASDSYDPDGYIKLYSWDWDNDGVFDENHTSPTSTHTFDEVGYYPVTLRVVDNDNISDSKTKTVRVGNHPPDTPLIGGKRIFKEGEGGEYPYTINSTDLEGDDICYLINWSDGTIVWTDFYESSEEITINVTIPLEKGNYDIFKIKAIDIFGAESNWATLEVTVPRNRATVNSLLQLFFERFPLLEVFLRAMNL